MQDYEIVYAVICRLGGARLDRIAQEWSMSRSTASRSLRELDMDYMVHVKNKVWYSTSAGPRTLGQAAKQGQSGSGPFCSTPGQGKDRK